MEIRVEDPLRGTNRGQTNGISRLEAALDGVTEFLQSYEKRTAYSSALRLRGKDLNLRPLGYEHKLMMASPFVSMHLVPDSVPFYPLFPNFCEHFVSIIRPTIPVLADANTVFGAQPYI